MASVWGELKRRNVVKVAVAYAIVGWLLVQIADTFFPALQLPEWTVTFVAGVVILGFPLALILSWAYELTPEGMERTKSVRLSESIAKVTGRKLDFVIIGVLAIAVAFFAIERFVLEEASDTETVADESAEAPPPVVVEEQREVLPNSVAVLLCDNLSPDPDDAYFAAGIHEEILNQLVKIRALNVIARTSVLQYADAPPPIPQIAEELRVEAVMECSVRYAGDAILVTAQPIDPETNSHLWSNTYPGNLSDLSMVFAMQADIAMSIANAFEIEFSLSEQESIEQIPTSSRDAYALYLRALSTGAFIVTSAFDLGLAVSHLDRATELDPQFALAYGYKALLLTNRGRGRPDVEENWQMVADEAAQRALEIDQNVAWAHAALGGLYHANWRGREAEQAFGRALELNPNDTDVISAYAYFKWDTAQDEDALSLALRLVELDPNGVSYPHYLLGLIHLSAYNYEAAETAFRKNLEFGVGGNDYMQRARIAVARGNYPEGIAALRTAEELFLGQSFPSGWVAMMAEAYGRAGLAEDAERLIAELARREQATPIDNADWALAALAMGDYEEAMARVRSAIDERELTPGPLQTIKANIYQDPVLEGPVWREVRARIHALD